MQNFAQAPENGSVSILLRPCVVRINRDVISVSTNHVRLQSNLTPKDSPLASAPKFYASARIFLLAHDYACVVPVRIIGIRRGTQWKVQGVAKQQQ